MSREAFRDDLVEIGFLEKYCNAEVVPLIQEIVRIDRYAKAIIKKYNLTEKHLPREEQPQTESESTEKHPMQILVS